MNMGEGELVASDECKIDDTMFLKITAEDGKEMMRLTIDGELIFAEGVTPEDAAERFASAVSGTLTSRKTREDVSKLMEDFEDVLSTATAGIIEGRLISWLDIVG